jgi:aldose 1-epimerase
VANTPFDFQNPHTIGERIADVGIGYDHNYVLSDKPRPLTLAARATEPKSGRFVEILTTEPGVQLYTGNYLDGTLSGKGGALYRKHAGFCLETQHFPDSVNQPSYPSTILRPGETFRSTTVIRCGVA